VVTDHLSDLLFTTETSGNENLSSEGIFSTKVHFVGNCMVDSLRKHLGRALQGQPWRRFNLEMGGYALVTLHRPANVDAPEKLAALAGTLNEIASNVPLIFPVHPRTRARLNSSSIEWNANVLLCEPLSYLEFLGLMAKAQFVMTDSGGIQEETTALRTPCLTLRDNTERPATIQHGSNILVGANHQPILAAVQRILGGQVAAGSVPPLWDGHAAARVGDVLAEWRASCSASTAKVAN
jgi:UDP-N-acetylglucosamine 2-epimerase (non-hydrolysing)